MTVYIINCCTLYGNKIFCTVRENSSSTPQFIPLFLKVIKNVSDRVKILTNFERNFNTIIYFINRYHIFYISCQLLWFTFFNIHLFLLCMAYFIILLLYIYEKFNIKHNVWPVLLTSKGSSHKFAKWKKM